MPLLLLAMPGAPSSVLAPSRKASSPYSFLLLVAMPLLLVVRAAPTSFLLLVAMPLLLVAMPGAPGSVLAPSSKARSP